MPLDPLKYLIGLIVKAAGTVVSRNAKSINFTGAGQTTTSSSDEVTVNIPGGGNPDWGDIRGTLSDQTDLQAALDAKADISMKVFVSPAEMFPDGGALSAGSPGVTIINCTDNADAETYCTVKPPEGATSISAIKVIYLRQSTGNLYLQFFTNTIPYSSGGSITTDSNSQATYAGGANDGTVGLITVPSAAYNGLTISSNNLITFGVWREGGNVLDTYNTAWQILGVMFEFA